MEQLHFWLRSEVKPGEKRTPLLPTGAKTLIEQGHTVTVEKSPDRCVKDEEYAQVGCTLVESGSWIHSPKSAIILGLKELPELPKILIHNHAYFGHSYKNQAGWEENLQRFIDGAGMLWDLEYLTYENGRRVAAFGRSAGFIGMAVGYMVWAHQQLHPDQPMPALDYHADSESIISYTAQQVQAAQKVVGRFPRSHVIGALGRCGGGACSFAAKVSEKLGVTLDVVKWDLAETQRGGPFPELLESDIVLNCIYLMGAIPPFITKEIVAQAGASRKMTVMVDVSCDTSNPYNPVPIYTECTTFFNPTTRVVQGTHPLDVVSIDHLPSLVPLESSLEFATDLFPHLQIFGNSPVWQNAQNVFKQKTSHLTKTLPAKHIWLRCELSTTERRTPLTPTHARQLIDNGFTVTVEKSAQRVFTDSEYTAVGCQLAEAGSWKNAPLSATILGLAELGGDDQTPLLHQHVYFGYCFKEQAGWRELLQQFVEGGGRLLDLEYLTLNSGERAASFSKMAGYIGAAAGLMIWCQQQGQLSNTSISETGGNFFSSIQTRLETAANLAGHTPNVVIIGAGKVGTGALSFMRKLGLETTLWTRDKTRQADPSNSGQGMPELLDYNIVINAIALNGYTAPFLTNELLQSSTRRTSVVVDVSCDVYNPHNPLPIYQSPTTFQTPARRILDHPTTPVDLIAIENLTGLLPRESSADFSTQLVAHLLYIADTVTDTTTPATSNRRTRLTGVWQRAESAFLQKTKILRAPSVTYTPPPSLILPADHPKIERLPHEPIHQNMTNTHHLSAQLSEKIRELAQTLNTDITHIITSTFQIILSRMCGEEDVMVGVATTNTNTTGLTASLKAARTNVTPSLAFQDFVHKVKITNSALSNVDDPNAILSLVDSPLPTLAVTLRQFSPLVFSTLVYLPLHPLTQTHIATLAYELFSQFELTLCVEDANTTNPIKIRISYASHLFDNNRMLEFTHQLDYLLTQAVANPRETVYSYSLLTPEASTVVPNPTTALNNTWPGPIYQHFFQQAKRLPNKVAVISKDAPVTYKQLSEVTARIASYIVSNGIKPQQTIAIYGYRNSAMVCAIMGILSAGASYSVIDPAYPTDRIIDLLSVAEPNGWIQIEQTGPAAPQVIDYLNTQLDCKFQLVLPLPEKIESSGLLKEYSTVPPQVQVDGESTAVVTFTSGSTGKPKGVLGRHAPLTGYYNWLSDRFGFNENDHFSMCSGIAHDPLQRDIFTPLYFGASLYIPEQKDIITPGRLAVWFRDSRISVCCLTPAMGQLLSETTEVVNIDSLRVALFVGDKLTRRDVFRLRRLAPQVTAVNMWGSTETQRSVSYYIPPPNSRLETMRDILPVGSGMKGCQVIILNSAGKVAGVGEVGELYMRSHFLSRGYKGLPQVNAEKFIQNPFTNTEGDRFYRSGDLGRYLPDGGAEVIGRTDDQVKIRGFRIELGEITTVLSQHPAVKENLIVVREDIPNDKRLVAYIIANKGYLVPPGAELRKFLQNKLPYYMVPSAFVVMKAFPLTPNGKINRAALPAPERVQKDHIDVATTSEGTSPQVNFNEQTFAGLETVQQSIDQQDLTEEERKVASIWADLLGTKFFSINDSFFEIGGHSLLVSKFLMTLKQTHKLDLGVEVLFNNPTVQGMAKVIEETQKSKKTTQHTSVDLNSEVTLPASISSSNVPSTNMDEVTSVLLTGATGFLGTFLLHVLLEQTKYTVYCLVRATTNDQGLARVKQSLTANGLWNPTYESRIVIVPGDLGKPVLGLTSEMFTHLAETIDVIVHSGAYVHWVYPYSKLKAINVLSTVELLRLATTTKLKAMHFISSTSVYESTTLLQRSTVSEDDPLSSSEGISTGYGQSKWVADRIVSLARTRGVPCNIYRCGYISGSTTTGVWTTDDFLCRLIKGCVQIQAFPDLQSATCDLLPVDFVAKRIVQIISNGTVGTTFNMCNSAAPTFTQLLQSVADAGYTLQQLPYLEWRSKLQQTINETTDDKNGNALGAVFGMFTTDYPAKLTRPVYQTTNSGITGTEVPAIETAMINYVAYFVRSGFIQAPANAGAIKEHLQAQHLPSVLVTRTQRTVA